MITRIQIRNFKSLEAVDLQLGGLNLLIGTNSSGKSNFLDALRVLQGIGNGFTISEVLNGKPRTATSEVWDGIRGGSEFATFRKSDDQLSEHIDRPVSFNVHGRTRIGESAAFNFEYHIAFLAKSGRVTSEWLMAGDKDIFDSHKYESNPDSLTIAVSYTKGNRGKPPKAEFERYRPVIHQFAEYSSARTLDRQKAFACSIALADLQRLDPAPDMLRNYSAAQTVPRMGEHGENFAALVSAIVAKEQNKAAYLEWMKELSPADVDDVLVLAGALNEPLFAVTEGNKVFPAQVLSDGTLRFAAITAAFFQESMPAVLLLEEIEKGVHPNRLRLLIELLRSQTNRLSSQVIATTHSPEILDWLSADDLRFTFITVRSDEDGATVIRPLGSIPAVHAVLKDNARLSELFSEGWLEAAA